MALSREATWTHDRMRLFRLWRLNPKWPKRKFAEAPGYSIGWVKKWLQRFQRQKMYDVSQFRSHSRAPKNPHRKVTDAVRRAILRLRIELTESYGRIAGPKTILFKLPQQEELWGLPLPTSPATIWLVLKESQPVVKKEKFPVILPDPMIELEFDLGEVHLAKDVFFEFAVLIDRGTSIVIAIPIQDSKYQADSVMEMLIEVFRCHGFPQRLRTDNDSRFVGPASADHYPSPFLKFAAAIGMAVILCPPGKPAEKPFVERAIGTIKHEKLYKIRPATLEDARDCLSDFIRFYNHERAHQGRSNNNQPPRMAHPDVPALLPLPTRLNPDAWIDVYHGCLYKRSADKYGRIQVDHVQFTLGIEYANEDVTVQIDGLNRTLHLAVKGKQVDEVEIPGLIGNFMDFDDYAELMIKDARAMARLTEDEQKAKRLNRR